MPVASVENLRERVLCELREIRNEIVELATDHEIYWKVQREVIQNNPRLCVRNPFLDMVDDGYAHAAALRVRRLVDKGKRKRKRPISLLNLLQQDGFLSLLDGKVTTTALKADVDELVSATSKVTGYVDQFVAHHDRNPKVDTPSHRDLKRAVDTLVRAFRKYHGVLTGVDFCDPIVSYTEDPLSIFRFAWIAAAPSSDADDAAHVAKSAPHG